MPFLCSESRNEKNLPSELISIFEYSSSLKEQICSLMRLHTICLLADASGSGMYSRLTKRRRAASSSSCGLDSIKRAIHILAVNSRLSILFYNKFVCNR